MKKHLLMIAIVLISVSALFAETYTVTYRVINGTGEDFTYGENGFHIFNGYFTTVNNITVSSSDESWSDSFYFDPNGPPPLTWILSFYLTRDETGYTITQTNTYNNMTITINCGGGVPDDPPMGH
jgi:hypothetical protein